MLMTGNAVGRPTTTTTAVAAEQYKRHKYFTFIYIYNEYALIKT